MAWTCSTQPTQHYLQRLLPLGMLGAEQAPPHASVGTAHCAILCEVMLEHAVHSKDKKYFQAPFFVLQLVINRTKWYLEAA